MKNRNSSKRTICICCIITIFCMFCVSANAAAVNLLNVMDSHAYKNTDISADAILPYRIYLPDAIAALFPQGADNAADTDDSTGSENAPDDTPTVPEDKKYGLLIWLHDEDLRGDDCVTHIADDNKNGLMSTFLSNSEYNNDFIILAPQCPADATWTGNDGLYLDLLIDLVTKHILTLPIDTSRILIGGLSMGASAGYELIAMQNEEGMFPIAAAYLLAGTTSITIENAKDASVFENTRIFAFLSENDPVTPADSVRSLSDLLITDYQCPITYVVYPELGHEIWHQAFAEQNLLESFMSVNAPSVDEPNTEEIPDGTTPPDTTAANTEKQPVQSDDTTGSENSDTSAPSIAGIPITTNMIAGFIVVIASLLAAILLLSGLYRSSRTR
ncbi:MAG: hypothetical protein IJC98_06970 [Clostridia bacterium]|nr:hypothetical protein [Clostridia bacterium]